MPPRTPTIVFALVALAGACELIAGQESTVAQPVIRAETATVVVDVIVTDRKGRHVSGLTAQDFRVFEDNAPQTVASFTAPAARQPAVAPPSTEFSGGPSDANHTPQLITLVIDLGDLHFESLKRACDAASRFTEKTIAAGNAVAIYWVDTSLHLGTPFTRDKQRALDVLAKLSTRAPNGRFGARERERTERDIDDLFTKVYPETLRGAEPGAKNLDFSQARRGEELEVMQRRERFQEMNMLRSWLTTASALQGRSVFVALRAMALAYRDVPGRKTVVLFSEGFRHAAGAEAEMQAVLDAANRANVAIYVISASGAGAGMGSAEAGIPDMTGGSRAAQDLRQLGPGVQSGGLNQFDWQQTLGSDLNGDLDVLSRATGGFLVKDTNDMAAVLDRVEEDASEFYTLAYYPSNHNYDGAFRKIKVEMAQREYRVRYRRGYWALPPGREILMTPAAAQLLAAVESGERKSSFQPQLNAALVPAPGGRFAISAATSMPGNIVRFDKLKDQYVAAVNLLLVAQDAKGDLVAVHERYGDVRLTRDERQKFGAKIFNMQGHVPIPELQPVSLQAIVRFADGTIGVSTPVKIQPPKASSKLSLTGMVLSDSVENADCSKDPLDPLCLKGRRILLPAQARFSRTTPLIVYFSALGVALDPSRSQPLDVLFRLGSGDKWEAFTPQQLRAAHAESSDALLITSVFDLQTLAPGKYLLEVTAEDSQRHARVRETAEFSVQ
jgi:VWFA-related protein